LVWQVTLVFAESAVFDLENIRTYYHAQGAADVGRDIIAAIIERIENIPLHPESGRVVPEFGYRSLREVFFPPFRIVYKIHFAPGSGVKESFRRVEIVRVWRSERILELPQ
jgi:plasmid stabilization system protein ParE